MANSRLKHSGQQTILDSVGASEVNATIDELVETHRARCLWYLRPDYFPQTDVERFAVLEAIQKCAGLDAFRRAGELKQCLLRTSSARSSNSSAKSESEAEKVT